MPTRLRGGMGTFSSSMGGLGDTFGGDRENILGLMGEPNPMYGQGLPRYQTPSVPNSAAHRRMLGLLLGRFGNDPEMIRQLDVYPEATPSGRFDPGAGDRFDIRGSRFQYDPGRRVRGRGSVNPRFGGVEYRNWQGPAEQPFLANAAVLQAYRDNLAAMGRR
jgi:hypothetical protein